MYCMVTDDDGHWYVIPEDKIDHWFNDWDPEDDLVPDYAEVVGGSPTLVRFRNFTMEKFL